MKSAAVHPKLSGLSRCRHYRTFFDGHWQGINLTINEEVWGHAQGQKVVCYGVFNKLIVALLHGDYYLELEEVAALCCLGGPPVPLALRVLLAPKAR
jgi:hypothetical protein